MRLNFPILEQICSQDNQNTLRQSDLKLDEASKRKGMLKILMKIWSGVTKFIKSQTTQGKKVDTGYFGTFYMVENIENADMKSDMSMDLRKFYYQPSTKFLDEHGISLIENEYNINPYQSLGKKIVKLHIQGIAYVCSCSPDLVTYLLSEFTKLIGKLATTHKRDNKMLVLNFKIGYLKVKQQKLRFLNYFEAK